jgi:transposase
MSAERIDMHRLQELVRLHRLGHGRRAVARLLCMSPNTERRYHALLAAQDLLDGSPDVLPELWLLQETVRTARPLPPPPPSSLEAWRETISDLLHSGKGPQAIFDALRTGHPDFAGSRSAVKRLCKRLQRDRGVRPDKVRIPVETAPGEVAQVDFGYLGLLYDPDSGVLRKAWVFVLVLGFSRKLFARIVFDQSVPTWLRLHVEAFTALGGVPRVIVPDNLKAAVVRTAFGADRQDLALQRSYRDLARHYGCVIDPTPVRRPEHKGKVESGVKYIKGNFLSGSTFADVNDARRRLEHWVATVADQRIHGTTGRRPQELFQESEQAALLPLPQTPFSPIIWHEATVHPDSHVVFQRRQYSVPFALIGQRVWLRVDEHTVNILHDDQPVAAHERRGKGSRSTHDSHLPAGRVDLRHRSRQFWEGRAAQLGDEVRDYIAAVFESDDVLSQLRTVQAIVTHLESFPPQRARAACRRAHHYACYSYRGIKDLLKKGLDLVPLTQTESPSPTVPLPTPTFARPIATLLHPHKTKEVSHDRS